MDQHTEAEIVVRVLKGDRQAYALLVEEYKTPVYNLAYRMTNNIEDAQDIAQEAFLISFRELSHYDTNRRFYTWLYTISLNLIRNHLKKAGRRQKFFHNFNTSSGNITFFAEKTNLPETGDGDTEALSREREKKLEICLGKLSPPLRELLILRFYQGLSFEMIAEITGASQSAVKMRIYRGLEKLQKYFEKM
ncbi:MAG: sigma-70 family RNA polymerase sigma factor [Deltaproteobacteria bacterium]|nr:sigma-70 family RNA polymerase sigma factor [Deltaproteobacteria bacterium]